MFDLLQMTTSPAPTYSWQRFLKSARQDRSEEDFYSVVPPPTITTWSPGPSVHESTNIASQDLNIQIHTTEQGGDFKLGLFTGFAVFGLGLVCFLAFSVFLHR